MNWKDSTKKVANDGDIINSCSSTDMNWKDAWMECHDITSNQGSEKGFTLDGVTNGMLTYNFRTRLDRVLYTSKYLNIKKIELIGTDRIVPHVNHIKPMKSGKKREIIIFPSDHYGLVTDVEIRV